MGRALSLRRRDRAGFSPVFPVAARPDDRPGTRVLSFPYLVLILKQIGQIILHLVHPVNRHFADIAAKECHNGRVLRGGPKRRGAWRSPRRGLGRASGGRPISPYPTLPQPGGGRVPPTGAPGGPPSRRQRDNGHRGRVGCQMTGGAAARCPKAGGTRRPLAALSLSRLPQKETDTRPRSSGPLEREGRRPLPGSEPPFPAATGDRAAADPSPLSGAKGPLLQTPL